MPHAPQVFDPHCYRASFTTKGSGVIRQGVMALPWFVPSLGECLVSSSFTFLFYTISLSYPKQRSYLIRCFAMWSVTPVVGYLCIRWCESVFAQSVNEKFHLLLSAHFILACKYLFYADLGISIGITLGAASELNWLWQTQLWSVATIL